MAVTGIPGALAIMLLASTVAGAAELSVGGAGAQFKTIAAAVAAAAGGDTVKVATGTYPESLVIAKTLTIEGEAGVLVKGSRKGSGITLKAPGITLSNLEIAGAGSKSGEAGIVVLSDGDRLEEITVHHNLYGAILRGAHDTVITGSTFAENKNDGLMLDGAVNTAVENNRFRDNGRAGLWLEATHGRNAIAEATGNRIANNTAVDNQDFGIALNTGANANTVTGNSVTRNGHAPADAGILLNCGPRDNVVEGNILSGNRGHGILLVAGSFRNTLQSNDIDGSSTGIGAYEVSANMISANRVKGAADYGIRLDDLSPLLGKTAMLPGVPRGAFPVSAQNQLHHNNLSGNRINAFDASGRKWTPPAGLTADARKAMEGLILANLWDDGKEGNYYDDFDEQGEGFRDRDGNGIGDEARAIPGGTAVDRFPLAQPPARTQ